MKSTLVILGCVVVVATLIPFLRQPHWWVRGFDFPRFQLFAVGFVILAAYFSQLESRVADYVFVAILLCAVLIQLSYILPFTRLRRPQVRSPDVHKPDAAISILVANVLMRNRRADDLLEIIERSDPDIVLTLETDAWWQEQLERLKARYTESVECPQDNLYGMHLYSKLMLIDPEIRFIVENDVPSIHGTVMMRSGHRFALHCLHPAPPSPSENVESSERDGELLIVGREIVERGGSAVVVGDLNDVAWSDTMLLFRKVSRLLDPRIGRGLYNTFNAKVWFVRWPLDHVFHTNDFTLFSLKRLPYFGSDHFPVLFELQHAPDAPGQQNPPKPEDDERIRASRKIHAAID